MLDGFKKIVDGIQEVIDPLNPMVSNLDSHKNKEIAKGLLNSGFSIEDITQFVDVSRSQLDPYLEMETEIMKRIEAAADKPKAK